MIKTEVQIPVINGKAECGYSRYVVAPGGSPEIQPPSSVFPSGPATWVGWYEPEKGKGHYEEYWPKEIDLSYLDLICTSRGGSTEENGFAGREVDIEAIIGKSAHCGNTLVKLFNLEARSVGFLPIRCNKWWCETCGGKNGKIHKNRLSNLSERINYKKDFLRQLIFTVPESIRHSFKSREGLNSLIKMSIGVVKKHFPGRKLIMYLHINGDREPGKFHPHVNIQVIESLEGVSWKIGKKTLEEIKADYVKRLRFFIKDHSLEKIDVRYSYRVGRGQISHSVRYMCRPWDSSIISSPDDGFQKLAVIELQNFKAIRYYGFKKGDDYIDDSRIVVPKGYEYMGLISRWELDEYCEREKKILLEGDDGVFYAFHRQGGVKSG